LKEVFEKNIDWSRPDLKGRNDYRIDIKDALICREDRSLSISIVSNFVVPEEDRKNLEKAFEDLGQNKVKVKLDYFHDHLVQSDEEALKSYLPIAMERINGSSASLKECIRLDSAKLLYKGKNQEKELCVNTVGKLAAKRLNEKAALLVRTAIKEELDIDCRVSFRNNEEDYEKTASLLAKNAEEQIEREFKRNEKRAEEARKNKKEKKSNNSLNEKPWYSGRKRKNKSELNIPASGSIILGRKHLSGAATALNDVKAGSGRVQVRGRVFHKESRTVKSGSELVIIYITDNKTSIPLKCFVSKDKWKEINSLLRGGDQILASGTSEINPYDKTLNINVDGIEKEAVDKRRDSFNGKKRVELHCHTKMSAMDGLTDPSVLVETAYNWGHTALAITDHGVCQAFPDAASCADRLAKSSNDGRRIKLIYGLEGYLLDDKDLKKEDGTIAYKKKGTNHIIILAASKKGLINLYKLVSISHLHYFYRKPRIPRSVLDKYREGLILGSACEAGEVYKAIEESLSDDELDRIASYYDYLEIQPISNNKFLIDQGIFSSVEDLRNNNRRIVAAGERLGIPVVATTDAHFDDPDAAIYRKILQAGQGYSDIGSDSANGLYLRTTEEMLEEFSYLGEEKAREVVIENSNLIAERISGEISPVPKGHYPPKIEGSEEKLRTMCMENAHAIYGDPLPKTIGDRLETELSSIIGNGYAVLYVSAQMLIAKSNEDGYQVGSRGSVGSSFAATMAGITEVNPLDPHYICPKCKYLEWGDKSKYNCGVDMPKKICPKCGSELKRDGFGIPFATFLGFSGNKEPDIDLNFASDYQQKAHEYAGKIFGEKKVFKAGTVSTVADKSAEGFVINYEKERRIHLTNAERMRLAQGINGVKKTTGQHPGGIIIVPDDREIFEFCPIQHPANDRSTGIITTHFDYHKIEKNLLKLDLLAHNVPSMIRHLQDMTGVDPMSVDLSDRKVLSIFSSTEALDIKDPEYRFTHGTYAVPEYGTSFVRNMLDDIKPNTMGDLVRIAGFAHGTNVWRNNAQDYIKSGIASMSEVISTRDDIMNYLIAKGLENKDAFQIMEDVRKNRPLKESQLEEMKNHDVPDWYIESCVKVQYLFPRAHAVAYALMSFRMAWYKVYYPKEFYAAHFTQVVDNFDTDTILKGSRACLQAIEEIGAMGINATKKDQEKLMVYEVAYEMYARGYTFEKPKLGKSGAKRFGIENGKVLLPYSALDGVGAATAQALCDAYQEKPFATIEEAVGKAKLNKNAVSALKSYGVFDGLPESDQISFFGMLG
jgi:DNA polymerase-3 subunit alpha (Gram-positive type)